MSIHPISFWQLVHFGLNRLVDLQFYELIKSTMRERDKGE